MQAVLSPKLAGARALEAALAAAVEDAPPDFFVVYSSLAATLGGFGQADYSAANGALEAFAESYALRHPETFCAAVAWGAWTETGMASQGRSGGLAEGDGQDGAGQDGAGQDGAGQDEREAGEAAAQLWRRLMGDGEAGIATAQGLEALDRILGQRIGPRVLVSPRALPELVEAYRRAIDPEELLRELEVPVPAGERHPRPPLQTRFVKAGTDLERQLAEIWQEQLGLAEVGILDNFFELGGTSLLGIQVVSQIRRRLDVDVPAVSLYEGSTVKALAELVGKLRGEEPAAPEEEQAASRSRGARRRELARLRQKAVGGGR
jgi:polyketide synthase 12